MNAHVAKLTFSELLIDICALAVAYSASNYLGWLIGHSALQGIMIYPAAGIAVAIMLGAGRRVWLGVLLGVVLLNLWIVLSPSASGGFGLQMQMPGIVALAATVQALLAVTLIRRRFGVTVNLTGSLDVITMLLYAGPVACAATATITGLGAYFHGLLPAGSAVEQGSKIWAGASLSVVAFLPLSLVTITPDNRQHGVLWKGAPLRHVLTPLASFVLLSGLFVTAFLANTINASNAQSHRKIFSLIVDRNVADIYREFGSFGAILDDTADRIGSHPHDKLQNWQQFLQPSMLYGLHRAIAFGFSRPSSH